MNHFFPQQGGYIQEVRPHMMSMIVNALPCLSQTSTLNWSGKALMSRSHYASNFPIIQVSKAPSIKHRRMACVNSMANVTTLFNIIALVSVDNI